MQTSSHENEAQRADDADGEHEQSTTLVELPLELLVKICLAVGSDDRASLCVVATSLASAVHEAAHIGGVATARLRTLLRGWSIRLRILESNGACACCGHRQLGAFSQVCSFCQTPFCGRTCMQAHWHVHRRTCGWGAARRALRDRGVDVPPRDGRAVIRLLRLHNLSHLLPLYLRPAVQHHPTVLEGEGELFEVDPEVY